jgi:YfiH family protein
LYAFRTTLGPVDLAFTDRYGGVSGAPYESLNLALDGDDDPVARAENLRRVVADLAPGDVLRDVRQVHGAEVHVVGEDPTSDAAGTPEADGIVAARPGVVLMVRAADCVPVLLADPEAGVIAAAHAGRAGLVAGIVPGTVRRMRELGAGAIHAWVGPHVCGACYEVPEGLRTEVDRAVPGTSSVTSWGTPSLDLGAGVRAQLEQEGAHVVDVSRCTRESPDLYSYRRDGRASGRIAGLVRRRPGAAA